MHHYVYKARTPFPLLCNIMGKVTNLADFSQKPGTVVRGGTTSDTPTLQGRYFSHRAHRK